MGQPIRIPPSGDFIEGGDTEAILIWDPALHQWVLGPVPTGGGLPLSTTWFVDPATATDPGEADGSIVKPFASLQAAFDAFALQSDVTQMTFACCAGDLGALLVTEDQLATRTLAIVGPANMNTNTAPSASCSVAVLASSDAAQLALENLYVSNVTASGGGSGCGIYATNCYIVDGDVSGWANFNAQGCFFVMGSTFNGPGNAMVLRECDWGGAQTFLIGSSTSWQWDDYTERAFFRAGMHLAPGQPNQLINFGADSDCFQSDDADTTITTTTRLVVAAETITADRTITVTGNETNMIGVVLDLYTQTDWDVVVFDGAGLATLYTHAAGSPGVRLSLFSTAPADATMKVQMLQRLDGA